MTTIAKRAGAVHLGYNPCKSLYKLLKVFISFSVNFSPSGKIWGAEISRKFLEAAIN